MSWLTRWSERLSQRKASAPTPAAPGVPPSPAATKMPPRRTWWTFIAIVLVNYMVVSWQLRDEDPLMVPYTAFKAEVAKGNVVSIYSQGAGIEGRFKTAATWPPPAQAEAAQGAPAGPASGAGPARPTAAPRTADTFATTLPAFVGPDLETFLIEHDVEISAIPIREGSGWGTLLWASARRC